MKITIIKKHHVYPLGNVDVPVERGNYLIKTGIAIVPVEPVFVKTKSTKNKKSG